MGNLFSKKCKECKMPSNKSFGKIDKDGFHNVCRTCSKCGQRFYYFGDVPCYVLPSTRTHIVCPDGEIFGEKGGGLPDIR